MSGLPPINLNRDEMLPTVYRRSDIIRQGTITGKQSLSGSPNKQPVDISSNGYKRIRNNCAAPVAPGAFFPKGMIIDVWT